MEATWLLHGRHSFVFDLYFSLPVCLLWLILLAICWTGLPCTANRCCAAARLVAEDTEKFIYTTCYGGPG